MTAFSRFRTGLSVLALALAASLPAQQTAPEASPQWAHQGTDLSPDPAAVWGALENGLRYVILPHAEPPGRASLRLFVDAGSLMEEEDQQGLAHFLEHMAFNGTRNYPPGELVGYLQRLGMGFGSDTNAHTFFKETVYKLELPQTSPDLLDNGLQVLRDYADGLLFVEKEIDDERGIILAEKRDRDSPEWRAFVDWTEFALSGTLVSKRLPIGTEEVIKTAPKKRFTDFYNKWYTADRMVVVVVGDVKPDAVLPALTKQFKDLRTASPRVPDPDMGTIPRRGLLAHHHPDSEATETEVSIEITKPGLREKDSVARRARDLRRLLAGWMVTRRLEVLGKQEGSPVNRASMRVDDIFDLNFADYGSIDASCEPGKWEAALSVIDQELRRVLSFGFTVSELAEAKANFLEQAENAAKSAATRKSRDLSDLVVSRVGSGRVFTHPAADLERVRPLLDGLAPEQCHAELKELWGDRSQVAVHVSGNVVVPGGTETILAAYRKAEAIPVEAPENAASAEFAYEVTGEPAAITSRKHAKDLDVTQIVFDNQVRANFKPTDFQTDQILVSVRIGSGLLTLPPAKPGLAAFASATFPDAGLEAHSLDDLKRIFAGKTVSSLFQVEDDAFEFSGQTRPADLLLEMQWLVANITHPGYREEAERQFKKNLDPLYTQLARTPEGILADQVERSIHDNDPRFGYPARTDLEARTLAEVREWLTPHLRNAYLEVSVVGDFELELAIDAVSRTFGSLPPRQATKEPMTEARKVSFPAKRETREIAYASEIPKAMVAVYWPTDDMSDIRRTRRLGLLSSILRDRLRVKIREELGDAYSPYARNVSSETFTGYGTTFALAETSPEQAPKMVEAIRRIGAALAAEGVSEDELERARKPMINMIAEFRRTNGYWMNSVLAPSQEFPQRLDWARSFVTDHEAITKADMDALAKKYFAAGSESAFLILPTAK
jgi:zinc protease